MQRFKSKNMNFLKINYQSPEREDITSSVYLPIKDIKSLIKDTGIVKQDDGSELKIERLTVTMNNLIMAKVPHLKADGTNLLDKNKKPMYRTEERNEMYFVDGTEIYHVLKQLDNV